MDSSGPICSLALQCQEFFISYGHVDRKIFGDYHLRFNTWVVTLRISYSEQRYSLDYRLKDAREVRDFVLRILNSIKSNLQLLLDLLQGNLLISDPAKSPTTSPEYRWKSNLKYAQKALQRSFVHLENLGVAIRRSSTTNIPQSVEVFTSENAKTSFEELSRKIVQSKYPEANHKSVAYLRCSVFFRYARLRYKNEYLRDLTPRQEFFRNDYFDEPSTSELGPVTTKAGIRADQNLILTSNYPAEITVALPDTGDPESTKVPCQRTPSMSAPGRNYPKPPVEEYAPGFKACEWCFEHYRTAQFEDAEWWRAHVDRDLLPYLCLSRACADYMPHFTNIETWKRHMEKNHSEEWAKEVHTRSWVCDIDHPEPLIFGNPKLLEDHIHGSHGHLFDGAKIKVMVEQSEIHTSRRVGICPLCSLVIDEDNRATHGNRQFEGEYLLVKGAEPGAQEDNKIQMK
ncbi:hypothetical protein F5Y06DRAFT_306938 [Hypoxylon sp. FL0890]|nr:hypothetical protein F5Y06DRAFT_306938 [Hypoxylon sp. FL0890]